MKEEAITFPIRLNRYLALKGVATRRRADEIIKAGKVKLNGKKAVLGDRLMSEEDLVEVFESKKEASGEFSYVAYYKPRGIVTSLPEEGQKSIQDVSGFPNLTPMGRLDKSSEGLILLTDDGRVTDRLLHPRHAHEKEYIVMVRERILTFVQPLMEKGIESEGEMLTAKKVTVINGHTLNIVLTEGKKHQIRRMLAAANLTVEKLLRVRVMGLHLGSLKPGQARVLDTKAKKRFLEEIGLSLDI
ncbi:MAG: pseudouridine synthase [Patescibacteria group bacterium]